VALLAVDGSNWGESDAAYNNEAVQTTQIAPTILASLGLNPKLDAVRAEGTQALPGLGG
jgi:hypothetical protein